MQKRKIQPINKICPNCSIEFFAYKKKIFCCSRCANTFRVRERRKRLSKTEYYRNCLKCDKEIYPPTRKFCSQKCKNLYNHKIKYKHKYSKIWQTKNPRNFLSTLLTKNRRQEYGLTLETLEELYDKQKGLCAITKIPMTHLKCNGKQRTNISLDRIDSNKGYEKDNIQLVCFIVNMMKRDMTHLELKDWCYKILKGLRI